MSEEIVKNPEYQAKYIRISKIKDLLYDGEDKLRISAESKSLLAEFLDNAVIEATQKLIQKLPRKSKGDHKGELSRITFKAEDFA